MTTELRQPTVSFADHTPDGAAGPWYVIDQTPRPRQHSRQVELGNEFLHSDGVWRWSTEHEGKWLGYYESQAAAQHALDEVQP